MEDKTSVGVPIDQYLLDQVLDIVLYDLVRSILSDYDTELTIYLKDEDCCIVYHTVRTNVTDREANKSTGEYAFNRTYHLSQLTGKETAFWGIFDLNKQAVIISNLIKLHKHKKATVNIGWEITCAKCGSLITGKHWAKTEADCKCTQCKKQMSQKDAIAVCHDVFVE
ncbi:MAG: hypothetical protein HQL51_11550 [Magnetococcales bacterium]|nr:hypothetical protein [Magnetococcales bacterium]